MMSWFADYTHRIDPQALKAAGVVGVARYLSYPTSLNKVIGQAEYDELRAAGIEVILNWEYDAHDWLGGASAGLLHAKEAVRQAKALGHPTGKIIPGSADFNMTIAQWNGPCKAYGTTFRNALNDAGYGAGGYGPWDFLGWLQELGGFGLYWQAGMSTSWSGGRNVNPWPGAHLRQRRHQTVGGIDTDYNDILRADWSGGVELGDQVTFTYMVDGKPQTWTKRVQDLLTDVWFADFIGGGPAADNESALLDAILNKTAGITDAQATAIATQVADALIASNANGLTQADHAAIIDDVRSVFARAATP